MKKTDLKTALAILLMATASSCYNLAPENNAGALTSTDIYSGVGNVLNIDSLVDYMRSIPKKWDFTLGYSSWRDDVEITYSYDGKHHKNVNIGCAFYNYDDVVPYKLTGDHWMDSLHKDARRKFDQVNEKEQTMYDALLNLCKSLACKVKPSNSSMWEYHEGDVDSLHYSLALREYPHGDQLQRFHERRVTLYDYAPEIINFSYADVTDSIRRSWGEEGNGWFNYEYTPDSVYNMTHELLDKKGFAKRIKPILRQKGIESREIYITHDLDCPIDPSSDSLNHVKLYDPKQTHSETKGIIYTIRSREQMQDVLRQLTATIWPFLDQHPLLYYEFTPDIYVPNCELYSAMKTYFTMHQYTPIHEEYTILVHNYKQVYHILLLDATGDLWLPKGWAYMKSWKNGEVIYDKKAKNSPEPLVGNDVIGLGSSFDPSNLVWDESSIVNMKK